MSNKVIVKPSGQWKLEGEDSRLLRSSKQIVGFGGQYLDPVFCYSCGSPAGFSLPSTPFIFMQCNLCRFGVIELPTLPEPEYRLKCVGCGKDGGSTYENVLETGLIYWCTACDAAKGTPLGVRKMNLEDESCRRGGRTD